MTQLTDQERTAQMNDMRSFDEQMPCVGIFWYDPADRSFEITPQMVEKAAEKGETLYPSSSLAALAHVFIPLPRESSSSFYPSMKD